jgi:ABC-type bacteriocin/lantibiotic exporter with double-glycine peptidase domain
MLDKAIEVSQLIHDIEKFEKREDTTIGERGINISGG